MLSRKIIKGFVLIIFVILFTACGQNESDDIAQTATPNAEKTKPSMNGPNTTITETPSAEAPKEKPTGTGVSKEKAELVFQDLSGTPQEIFEEKYGKYIRKQFPNYDIKFIQWGQGTSLPELILTGDRVDIVLASVNTFIDRTVGAELDMTDLMKSHNVDMSQLDPALMNGLKATFDQKLYALPITQIKQSMFYNKDIFDKFGVGHPTDDMTWDETLELAKRLSRTDGDNKIVGYSFSPVHLFSSNQLSLPYIDPSTGKPTFMDDRWQDIFNTYALQFAQTPNFRERTTELKRIPYRQDFSAGTLAMFVFNSQFPFDVAEKDMMMNWDIAALPSLSSMQGVGSQALPIVIGMTMMAKDQDAAMNVIKYLTTSEEVQSDYSKSGIIPAMMSEAARSLLASETIYSDKNWNSVFQTNFATMSYKSVYDARFQSMAQNAARDLVTGSISDINTALRSLQEEAERYIAEQKSGQ